MGNVSSCGECCETGRSGERELRQVMAVQQAPQTQTWPEPKGQHGVGLVLRTTRDGKMVVSSFVKDSSAYECGLVRDGGER